MNAFGPIWSRIGSCWRQSRFGPEKATDATLKRGATFKSSAGAMDPPELQVPPPGMLQRKFVLAPTLKHRSWDASAEDLHARHGNVENDGNRSHGPSDGNQRNNPECIRLRLESNSSSNMRPRPGLQPTSAATQSDQAAILRRADAQISEASL